VLYEKQMKKLEELQKIIKKKESMVVAFSGGIDSSLVAKVAFDMLRNKTIAVTLDSDVFPKRDLIFSKTIAKEIGIKHIIIQNPILDDPAFITNSENRCYHCKKRDIDLIGKIANEHNIKTIAYGVNVSDQREHRPGISALKESNIFFPLEEAGIGKSIIPQIAQYLGLSNYNMPSTTCLASRIPYGNEINMEKLIQIEEAENFLYELGIRDSRARHHGDIVRIEVSDNDIHEVVSKKVAIIKKLKDLGFKYISLDLQGYRSGSMDEVL
jgi:pyridinium-3,5-biscarboxylic acid mononucleotide sulfurtransferase